MDYKIRYWLFWFYDLPASFPDSDNKISAMLENFEGDLEVLKYLKTGFPNTITPYFMDRYNAEL